MDDNLAEIDDRGDVLKNYVRDPFNGRIYNACRGNTSR